LFYTRKQFQHSHTQSDLLLYLLSPSYTLEVYASTAALQIYPFLPVALTYSIPSLPYSVCSAVPLSSPSPSFSVKAVLFIFTLTSSLLTSSAL
jgi:hypothetical protein